MNQYINFNGQIIEKEQFSIGLSNRAFRFGDSIFETIRVFNGKVIFLDNHYQRLISSLEVVKMKLPDFFTASYFDNKIKEIVNIHNLGNNARIRFTVFRKASNDIYFVDKNQYADFIIEYSSLDNSNFIINDNNNYEIDVYEEIHKPIGKLSQIKTNNVLLHSIAGAVVLDKSINNIILVNDANCLTEAVNSNIFLVKDKIISTPLLADGCVDGVMRKTLIKIINKDSAYRIEERQINKNELLDCDEVFLTNSIIGIQIVNLYKGKKYRTKVSSRLLKLLIDNINSLMDL